jgi:threonine dehydrogenase-like Zn-dependent dehydrogenase
MTLPTTQRAVQLVAPNELQLNDNKDVFKPGPHQVLGKVEVVGLCFSDLKLLKQYDGHVRKSDVLTGLDTSILSTIPSYAPNQNPTVPGHETVVRIVEAGDQVQGINVGDRFLVQTDYRWLKTEQSNAAFGYNFEGALQEYVLMDQRVITDPEGESMLIPAADDLPASSVALVEPWACVEDSYVVEERQTLKEGGRLLVVNGGDNVDAFLASQPKASEVITFGGDVDAIEDESIDDILFFGADADLLEKLFPKAAKNGLVIVVQGGEKFSREVTSPVGRFHYGGVRLVGTASSEPGEAMAAIPATGEIREGDRIDVVGAGGPMGTMHVIRDVCQGVKNVSVYGGDMSDERLAMLDKLTQPLAEKNGVSFSTYNAKTNPPEGAFDYLALMVPVPALVADAIARAEQKAIINIFAGIPATVYHPLDLDTYVERQLYFIGTSGSVIEDMKIVLNKVTARTLDTNLSVAAVSGLDGAVEGIRAVENQLMPGKIIVYPSCKGLGLTPLDKLGEVHPEVAALLDDGTWTKAAEEKLLELYG